jgi:formylglycine-generating enzyme required for sulfatase activity
MASCPAILAALAFSPAQAQSQAGNVQFADATLPDSVSTSKQNLKKKSPSQMNMVTIEPGRFELGSPMFENKRRPNEGPVQSVYIGYTFEVGKYEVTFAEWDKCLADGGCNGHRPDDGGWGRGKRPVINISWQDTQNYLKWLNKKTGNTYRLLSESEWEYLARAGSQGPFTTGPMITTQQANFNGETSYGGSPLGVYRRKTVPVGSYAANATGLHDLHGNVWEWTQDCWNPSHSGAPTDGRAREEGNCKYRVMKGGSWVNKPNDVRTAQRQKYTPDYRYDDYGFRFARTLSK